MTRAPGDDVLDRLYRVIAGRRGGDPKQSHTARLFARGTPQIAKKLGEEAVETVIAAMARDRAETIDESADLLFHLLILLADAGIEPGEVLAELERREGTSGFDLKRKKRKKLAETAR